jgi:hypothetical protein
VARQARRADEQDVVTGWRRVLSWRRDEVAAVKRRMRRRERHDARRELRRDETAGKDHPNG